MSAGENVSDTSKALRIYPLVQLPLRIFRKNLDIHKPKPMPDIVEIMKIAMAKNK
jgi:hypothetical protein